MVHFNNFAELLACRASQQGKDTAYVFLQDGENIEITITYEELYHEALKIASHLRLVAQKGDRVLLFYPSGLEFIKAFFACMYAGVIAVPSYPPRMNKTLDRLTGIIEDCKATCILTDSTVSGLEKVQLITDLKLSVVCTDQINPMVDYGEEDTNISFLTPESIAFLQYTSGSTGMPKGVMVSHKNILSNQALIKDAFNQVSESVIVGWLPFYHDMGLIGNILHPVYLGAKAVLMSPIHFLMKPSRWLAAISKYKGTTSGAPNFAYELCYNRIGEEDKQKLDLSTWKVAFCGAEPIRPSTVEKFKESFAVCGFQAESFQPCYGMAETTLLISAHQNQQPVKVKEFIAASLTYEGKNEMLFKNRTGLVSCGKAKGFKLKIVGADFHERSEGQVGEIWVQGDSVSNGYWNKEQLNKEYFEAVLDGEKYFRTGDLGILDEGELYIAGRIKDLIILNGRNLYPQDIEHVVVQCDQAIVSGSCAAFSLGMEKESNIVIVCEVDERKRPDYDLIVKSIRKNISNVFELDLHDIVFIKRNSLPKTTSGKIQRYACRENYINKSFQVVFDTGSSRKLKLDPIQFENEIEEKIYSIVEKITGHKIIALDDNFFSLGMDSLKVTALAMELDNEFDIDFEIVFEYPSIKALAAKIISFERTHKANPVYLGKAIDHELHELSSTQLGIWMDCKIHPRTTAYNIFSSLQIPSSIDDQMIFDTFNSLIAKHSILRTSFVEVKGKTYQKILSPEKFNFETIEFESKTIQAYREYQDSFKSFIFQLNDPFLFRIALVKAEGNKEILFLAHHIITDGSSIKALFEEWLYVCQGGKDSSLLSNQFVDYSNMLNNRMAGDLGILARNYWMEELKGIPSSMDLPFTRTLPEENKKCNSASMMLDITLLEKLDRISRKNEVSLSATLLSAFSVLLNRLSAENDIVIGTPFSLRDSSDSLGIQGPLVNAVFLRNKLNDNASFNLLLRQMHEKIIRASKYKFYPLASIVQDLNLSVIPGKFPIAQVFFNFLNFIHNEHEFDTFQNSEGLDLNFYINCYVARLNNGFKLRIDYREALFERQTIVSMMEKYHAILSIVGSNDDTLLKEIRYRTFHPSPRLFEDAAWYSAGKRIQQVLSESLIANGNRIAVATEQHCFTYADIDRITDGFCAKFLNKYRRGKHVVLLTTFDHSITIGIMSCIKAGLVYSCLDPKAPVEILKAILLEIEPSVILLDQATRLELSQQEWLSNYDVIDITVNGIDGLSYQVNTHSKEISVDDLLYILYTSGTTGTAKGVMQNGENLLHYMSCYSSFIKILPEDKISGLCAPSYDSFNKEFFGAILNGASYHPCSVHLLSDPMQMFEWLESNEITIWQVTPVLYRYYANDWQHRGLVLKTVRVVKMTGDTVRSGDFDLFKTITLSHAIFVVSLGSTESSLHTIHSFTHEDYAANGIVPVGFPVHRTEVLILDANDQELDVLERGELVISSDYISPGYYYNNELNSLKFFFKDGKRYFRSGDIGRSLTDGKVEWLARNENNSKIRGIRVSLKELDYRICRYPGISDSYSIIKETQDESIIVSYFVSLKHVDVLSLRHTLKMVLPEHNVSSHFVRVDEIPLTSNGKVDRNALMLLKVIDQENILDHIPPRTDVEKQLVDIWKQLLGRETIGITDDFFTIGGNSIQSIKLTNAINATFQTSISGVDVFKNPTVKALAYKLFSEGRKAQPVEHAEEQEYYDLTNAQLRIWIQSQLVPYTMSQALTIDGNIDVEQLEKALYLLVERHESLRTNIVIYDGLPLQKFIPFDQFKVDYTYIDISGENNQAVRIASIQSNEIHHSFDLENDALFKVTLVKRGKGEYVYFSTMHHIIGDGWSTEIFTKDLMFLYSALVKGKEPLLEPMVYQFKDYVAWEKKKLTSEEYTLAKKYWTNRFAHGIPRLTLPLDRPRADSNIFKGAVLNWSLPGQLSQIIRSYSSEQRKSLFTVILATFKVLLFKYSNFKEVVIGTIAAGREDEHWQHQIGMYAKTLILKTDLSEQDTFETVVDKVWHTHTEALQFSTYPVDQLAEDLKLSRHASHAIFFDVLVILHSDVFDLLSSSERDTGLAFDFLQKHETISKFDMTFNIYDRPHGFYFSIEYNSSLFDEVTVSVLMERYAALLEEMLACSDEKPLGEFSLKTKLEKALEGPELDIDFNF